ncbi:MAG: D-cysteine desulfhydrase family protein [Anaerolineales bacterium]|nr:D-cysteine desulfhydrase family protein [Anaerolineales bacterium]
MARVPDRFDFAHLPTALDPLPQLSRSLGGPEIWVKRDDMTGLAFGGNKTRKLEFLAADAAANNARTLITRGAAQSNHCRQTAAAARRCGLACTLVLTGTAPAQINGNLLLDNLLSAEIIWTQQQDPDQVLQNVFAAKQKAGDGPYLIPYGGSNEVGASAYAFAIKELKQQDAAFDRIVFASSSGGTQAGMVVGAHIFNYPLHILGISVDLHAEELSDSVASLATRLASFLGEPFSFSPGMIDVDDSFLGGGYGVLGDLESEAVRLFAREEGILLDPVYTGRAAGGLIHLIRSGAIGPDERVLFWHTGGTPALFAYAEGLIG